MTWTGYHNRGEVLRNVMTAAGDRRDGLLPMDVEGVAERFADELDLLGALQLKWHTSLAGGIERELADQPMDLESAVVRSWQRTADEMPGVREILDHYRANPTDERMARVLTKAAAKEHILLAAMAGRGGPDDQLTVPVGERIAAQARATYVPGTHLPVVEPPTLLDRIKAALAA